ncbi:hypothetical protein LKF24_1900 [Lactococcus lactis subsp. lactis]|nr:hypothetical protein LKF24_1900 [Lactococcus lactis subsp. lactis]
MDNSKLFGEAANEEQLLKNDYRKYRGENMDIYYNVAICEHAGECVRGNPLYLKLAVSLGLSPIMAMSLPINQ